MTEIALLNYYGLDWLAMLCGFAGMWLLGKKRKVGFLFSAGGMIAGFVVSIIASQYGFIVANAVMFGIAVRNYVLWALEERKRSA